MLNYHHQSKAACLAYSLYNIGAINEEALREYEAILASGVTPCYKVMSPWLSKYAKPLDDFFLRCGGDIPFGFSKSLRSVPKKGKGVAIWDLAGSRHAMSWEDGMLLDPEGYAEDGAPGRPESIKEVKDRIRKFGINPRLLACIEV